jgi:predicted metal-dependent peptidase
VGDVDLTVTGRGGTDFNPPFIRCQEMLAGGRAVDLLVYATDGYAPPPDVNSRVPIPVVWLLTPNGQVPAPDYGIVIRMEPF